MPKFDIGGIVFKMQDLQKQVYVLLLVCILACSTADVALAAGTALASSSNIYQENYGIWSRPVASHLYQDGGELVRVEYISGAVVMERYDASFVLKSSKTIEAELPLWGGFFAGEDYNLSYFRAEECICGSLQPGLCKQ